MRLVASRLGAWIVTASLGVAVLSPLALPRGWDSFPISSFPMFSRGDLGTVISLDHAILVTRDGSRRPAPPAIVGTPEPMVAKAIIEQAIARGTAIDLCARIAERARGEIHDAVTVEIVNSLFDTRRYFEATNGREPLRRSVHARCPVAP